MWLICLLISVGCLPLAAIVSVAINKSHLLKSRKVGIFNALFAGAYLAAFFVIFPMHNAAGAGALWGGWHSALLSAFNAMQMFALGCDYGMVKDSMAFCPEYLHIWYQLWTATLFVLAPIFTFGFILSLFKNITAYMQYILAYSRDVYVFSKLDEPSLTLARDIKAKHKKAAIVFANAFEDSESPMLQNAKKLGAICFKNDILAVALQKHSRKKAMFFFLIGQDEAENLTQALQLIEDYKTRENTHIYVFCVKTESQLLLTAVDKGCIKVRRINHVQSLINRLLYTQGSVLFESARETASGSKQISAVVVGMGRHGTEMVKALAWFGQMDGYTLQIHAFDKDPQAEEKFTALAPELMSPVYNGVTLAGEAQYTITVHSGVNVDSASFAREIEKRKEATYVMVALGNDEDNIRAAVNLRMYFERMQIHPVIQAIVYDPQQKKALEGIRNYSGQPYDIAFIGDVESYYSEDVIINSELEEDALQRHLKWGKEEEFWTYEYNYRSSMASAIHMRARIFCNIPGATKKEEDLSPEERNLIEVLEHRRWNAYMRAEGYVYSGSKDKSSRNDLAKMHHNLVDFSSLSREDQRKDGQVGSR